MRVYSAALLIIFTLYGDLIQSQKISIVPIPVPSDQSFTNIVGMCQDKNGFVWLADNFAGLYRYDGSDLKSYKSNPANSNSLSTDNLECLYPAADGSIWIGTYEKGLDHFDPVTEQFTHYKNNPDDNSSLISNHIGAILEDRSGTLWIGTAIGLDTFDQKTGKFIQIQNNTPDGQALSQASVRVIYEDKLGTIWIGCGNPFGGGHRDILLGGLYKLEKSNGRITRYQHNVNDESTLTDNRVRAIFEDSRGVFWVGTAGDGLHVMDRSKGSFQRFPYRADKPNTLSRPPVNRSALYAADHITFINEDRQGFIWIGTYAAGLNRYNPVTNTVEHFGTSANGTYKLARDDYWAMLKTDDLLWVSGWEPGNENEVLYKISTFPYHLNHTHLGSEVLSFAEEENGNMWIGTSQGLIYQDVRGEVLQYPGSELLKMYVRNLELDSFHTLWVSSNLGIYGYDLHDNSITQYQHDPSNKNSISSNDVFVTKRDGEDKLWIGTTQGLNLMNLTTGEVKEFFHIPDDSTSLNSNWITAIEKDGSDNLWVGNLKGLNRYIHSTSDFQNGLDLNGAAVFAIFEDHFRRVWISTYRSGLYVYDPQMGKFSLFTDSTGIIKNNLLIKGIGEDKDHMIWLNTDVGFFKIDPATSVAMLYGKSRSINPKNVSYKVYTAKTGNIFIGDKTGYYHFLISDSKLETEIFPRIHLSDFFLGNEKIKAGVGRILSRPLFFTEKLELDHNQNSFSIEFQLIDYQTHESDKNIQYKLDNYDDAWKNVKGEKRVYFQNLSPGHYVFHLRAANMFGNWDQKKLEVLIHPPWWGTNLFRIIGVLGMFLGIVIIIRWRNQKLRKQLEQSEKETELLELKRQKINLEMDLLRAQMNPHFIFNSLNSINRYILKSDIKMASSYLIKFSKLIRLIMENSRDTLISIENELESIRLYLELESLRFNHSFEYKISIQEDMETEILKIPPLILQPYVENAIWHGLMNKEEKGHLEITLVQEKGHIIFRITDDGIGRLAAAALKENSIRHKSLGQQVTEDRIKKLPKINGIVPSVKLIDLIHPDGIGSGTQVLIKIPMMYD